MAEPNPGKCTVVVLVLVLVLYTGYAFKIREPVQSTVSLEQSRSNVCTRSEFGKCLEDDQRIESSSTLSPSARRKHETDVNRVRIISKSRQPPVETVASDEDNRHVGKIGSISNPPFYGKFDKWTRHAPETNQIKGKRSAVVDDVDEEESAELVVTEEDDDDDDVEVEDDDEEEEEEEEEGSDLETVEDDVEEIDADSDDDDGVEISNASDEGSEEIIDADEDDNYSQEISKESDEEEKLDSSPREDDTEISDDDKIKIEDEIPKSTIKKLATRDAIDRISKKFAIENKISTKVYRVQEDSDDEEAESTKKESSTKITKETKKRKEVEDDKKVIKDSEKKVIKKDGKHAGHVDKEKYQDEDVSDEEDDNESASDPEVIPPPRKLEKVRLADKEKAKSVESVQKVKPLSEVSEKPAKPKESSKKMNEAPKKNEEVTKVTKPEPQKSKVTIPTKSEAKVNPDISSKPAKDTTSKVPEKPDTNKSTVPKDRSKSEVRKSDKLQIEKTKEDNKSEVKKVEKKSEEKSKTKPTKESKSLIKKIDKSTKSDHITESKSKPKKRRNASISLTELNEAILQVPSFVLNFTAVEDPVCQKHGKIFLRQLRGYKLWALQMLDAGAKIPSGLLRGNINQLGDFDQCLGIIARVKVDEKTIKVQGKYCLAALDLHASLPDMKVAVNLMQSRGFIRGSMRDLGHFIPRFTTASWAVCIPAACSAEDARSVIENALSHLNVSSGLRINVAVDPEMCYVRQKEQTYSKETIGVLYFYAMIMCVVTVATVRDYLANPQGKGNYSERIIMSFSLRRTLRILTKEGRSDDGEISCIHGIRSIATIALYIAHKMIPIAEIPYANRITLTEIANNPISSVLRASLVYTDCFLLLSGVLTAFNMARETAKRGEIRWFCRYVARFIRLTPVLLIIVFWYAYVMEHTGSGPKWNSIIVPNAELCKRNAWTNLLYIQNFFPFEEMCATHTHQLALDMQLTLLAPVLVFFLTFKPIVGILLAFFLLQVSATLRYFATINNNLTLIIFHGTTIKQLFKSANFLYALPLHRATPYIFGVALGVLLHFTGKTVRIYRIFVILGWLIAGALGFWSLFSPWRMARRDYSYDVEEATHYAVISPVSWSISICWIIFACFTNHGGAINKFLSSYWMIIFSRISYSIYLCQFAIFFYNVGTTRYGSDVAIHKIIDPFEAGVVILVSIILTLLIDIPMQEVKSVIMESTDGLAILAKEESAKPEESEGKTTDKSLTSVENVLDHEKMEKDLWERQDDAVDGLTRQEDSADEEMIDKWRPKMKSNGTRRSFSRYEGYEDDEDQAAAEEEEEEEEEDHQQEVEEEEEEEGDEELQRIEWGWVKRPRSRMSVEDDGLIERGRRSRSGQRSGVRSYLEPDTGNRDPGYQYQREDDFRRERRSLSRQPDRSLRQEESPRGSLKRERSAPRILESKTGHYETEDLPVRKLSFGSKSRVVPSGREYEKAGTPSRETGRHERSLISSSAAQRESFPSGREYEKAVTPSRETGRHERSLISSSTAQRESFPSGKEYEKSSVPQREAFLSGREYEKALTPSRETGRHERSPRPSSASQRETVRLISSGSEEEPLQRQQQYQRTPKVVRRQAAEPIVSDEEDWEQELRIRRRKFMERLTSEEREVKQSDEGNDGWDSVKRRSSAEGKLALLKGPTGSNVMDSWTVSRGPRVSLLGSSQETEEDNSYAETQKVYQEARKPEVVKEDERSEEDDNSTELSRRHSYTSGSQVTSLEEEEDVANYDFVLKKGSKRITVMDLSKLTQQEESETEMDRSVSKGRKEEEEEVPEEENEQPKMATLKLFKRESIVKSQASEEDPEYLLPERPKLMEQEQDHPFKKAWQLQKSRSEEDGSAYALKEVKSQSDSSKSRAKDSKDTVDNTETTEQTSAKSTSSAQSVTESLYCDEDTDTPTVWQTQNVDIYDSRESSKSGNETDSAKIDCPSEDEEITRYKLRRRRRRQSEEANYSWELEET